MILRGDDALIDRLSGLTGSRTGLCRPSIGELWFMAFNSTQIEENCERIDALCRGFHIWEFDEAAAIEFGRIRVELRRAGRPIPMIDVQIASIARSRHLTLLSSDGHFNVVANLRVENWISRI